MITAVDTNVLLDVLIPGAPHSEESERALAEAVGAGALLISGAVYAELAVHFPDRMDLDRFLADTGIRLEPSGGEALYRAGRAWSEYLRRRPATVACPQCGAPRRCVATGAARASSLGSMLSRNSSSEPSPWSTQTGCSPETGATTPRTSPELKLG